MGGLRVAVVGAGIAGLTVAACLARTGVACTVFERAGGFGAAGAGIQLAPNASRLLHRLGLATRLDAVAVRPRAIEMRGWRADHVLARTDLGAACEAMYGAPYYTLHRADLHASLRGLVEGVAEVRLGQRCVGVSEGDDGVRVRLADGSLAAADVVVGADGIGSVVRDALARDEARFTGVTVYRGLVRADRVAHLCADPAVRIWLGPGQHCVCYPISAGAWVSFVAVAPDDARPRGRCAATESWTASGRVADLLAAYAGWPEPVRGLLAAADSVTRWALHDRAALPRWHTRRVTVIGDAAHPMLPFGAQGANQAVEDAVALASCLRGVAPAEVPDALRAYERVRMPRVARVAAAVRANAREHHVADGDRQRERDRTMGGRRCLRAQRWLYGYDAERAALDVAAVAR